MRHDPMLAKYSEKFIDGTTGEPVPALGGCRPRFFLKPVQNADKSKEAGRPVYDDVEFVEIHIPQDPENMPVRPVREEDRRVYAREYQRFLAERQVPVSGYPLQAWPIVTSAQVLELSHLEIRTVEQLAEVRDDMLPRLGALTPLRDQARTWIGVANGAAPAMKAQEEISSLKAKLEEMERRLAQQQTQTPPVHAPAGAEGK